MQIIRPEKDEWAMCMAFLASTRSTCVRRNVGAIIVDDQHHILSTGYNGVPRGAPHCHEQHCPGAFASSGTELDSCMALHAEQNAVTQCSRIERAHTLYTTTKPCMSCMKLLIATPINKIVYYYDYPNYYADKLWVDNGREIYGQESFKLEPNALIHASILMGATVFPTELKFEEGVES